MEHLQAVEIWKHLNHRFGLHFRKKDGRDNQLYNKLKESLDCPKETGIGTFLECNKNITALQFV
ncbi:TPA: hypothetical protein QCU24_002015 [Bacillus cereus]|nr:hypothetical protein [Bacillus cereus]